MGALKHFARSISTQYPLGLATYQPEPGAEFGWCFQNVKTKIERSGGRHRFGWTFSYKKSKFGHYFVATHHAVWHAPSGHLIDVTPFHENPEHHPLSQDGGVFFQVDDSAEPVVTPTLVAPLPLKFFAEDQNTDLRDYVAELGRKEEAACREIYGGKLPDAKFFRVI